MRLRMRLWLCISVLFCFCTVCCWAEEAPAAKSITLELGASKTRNVLAAFFLAADKHCIVDPSVPEAETRPISFKDVPFDTALKLLSRQLKVKFTLKDDSYTAMPLTDSAAKDSSQPSSAKPDQVKVDPKAPVVGMSKQQVLAILGQPTSSQGEVIGYETWFYTDWIIKFQKARVAEAGPPPEMRVHAKFKPPPEPEKPVVLMITSELAMQDLDFDGRYATGLITNVSEKPFRSVYLDFNVYNAEGAQIGNALESISNLEAGGKWRFRATVPERDAAMVRFKSVEARH